MELGIRQIVMLIIGLILAMLIIVFLLDKVGSKDGFVEMVCCQ